MDFKKILKLSPESFDPKNTAARIGSAWMKHKQVVFILLVIFAALAGGYVWYESLYKTEWSQEQKDTYNLSQTREVNLKTDLFEEIVMNLDERGRKLDSARREAADIFKPY